MHCEFSNVKQSDAQPVISAYLGSNQNNGIALSLLLTLNDIKHLWILLFEGPVEELLVRTRTRVSAFATK